MTIIRVDPLQSNSAEANDILTFVIPEGVFDLSSLKMWFQATISGSTTNNQSLPRDVETLIEHLEVYINEQKVQHINHYNQLFRIIEDYNKDWNEHNRRSILSNSFYIPNGLNGTIWIVNGSQFAMTKWLGFLGCKEVINTRVMGPIRIVITLAPNNVILGDVAASTYRLSDVHMTLKKLPDDTKFATRIEFDNFKTLIQYQATFNQSTQLDIRSRELDYIIATFLPMDYKTRAISTSTNFNGTSYYFTHGTGTTLFPPINWNFLLDQKPAIEYSPNHQQFLEYMNEIFPLAFYTGATQTRTSGNIAMTNTNIYSYVWAVGVSVKRDARDGINVSFRSTGLATATNVNRANHCFVSAKCNSLLEYNPDTGKYDLEL